MRNPKLGLVALIVLALTVALVFLLPHSKSTSFWVAFCFFLAGEVAAFAPQLLPSRGRDFVFALPAMVMLAAYLAGSLVVLVMSNFVGITVVLVLDLILAAAVGVVAVFASMHADASDSANELFTTIADEGTVFEQDNGRF